MKPRVAELRAIVPLLEAPAEDVEELATRIIEALSEARLDRTFFYLCPEAHNVAWYPAFGPFSTVTAVDRFAKKIGFEGYATIRTEPYAKLEEL